MARRRRLPRSFYRRDPLEVAPELIGALVEHDGRRARVVEVEAYRGIDDPASHAYRGPTPRTAVMFGPPGHLYVYLSYGMHWCANVVCAVDGVAGAVLLRAAAPEHGIEVMRRARPVARRDRDLASGPAKLCQAMGIDRRHDGADLVAADRGVTVTTDGWTPPVAPATSPRIGISAAADRPWRWYLPGDPNVSARPR